MKDYTTYTNEELVNLITGGNEEAYGQLFENLKPITLHEAEMYMGKMETYGKDDFLQEGQIVAWQVIIRGNFKGGGEVQHLLRGCGTEPLHPDLQGLHAEEFCLHRRERGLPGEHQPDTGRERLRKRIQAEESGTAETLV